MLKQTNGRYIPEQNKAHPRLSKQGTGQHNPIHQPWCQQRRIGGFEGLIGGKDGEDESWNGTEFGLDAVWLCGGADYGYGGAGSRNGGSYTHDKRLATVLKNMIVVAQYPSGCSTAEKQ